MLAGVGRMLRLRLARVHADPVCSAVMPHAVPLATLAVGLGMLGGSVAGIHALGSAGTQAPRVLDQQVDDVVSGDRPFVRGHHCRRHDAARLQAN